jgi:2-iminobutanoate/2-iminopropanoate deaminase
MSLLKRVHAPEIPEPPADTYSPCLMGGGMVYVAGQHAGRADGTIEGDGTMGSQAAIALQKIKLLVEAAGATMADVAKLNVYVTDISQRSGVTEARKKFFKGDFPTSTLVEISALAQPGLLVEIDAVAVHPRTG